MNEYIFKNFFGEKPHRDGVQRNRDGSEKDKNNKNKNNSVPHLTTFYAKGVYETMKMMTGVIPKETMEISEILASDLYGQMISVN